jgi:transposase
VAFEATIGWGWLADLLADAGVKAHMAHPLSTRAIATARVKNDAVDAKTLAHLLRTHLLPGAWIAPLEVREARRLVRMRAGLVRIRGRLKCQIHALVAEAGVNVAMTDLFGRGGRELLADLKLPAISQDRLEANLRLIDTLCGVVDSAEREIAQRFRGDPCRARLLPIPGIGPLGAATIVAEVWDVGRFATPERLTSWPG